MTRTPEPTRVAGVMRYAVTAAAAILAAGLVWGLRALIVPAFVGALLAYICSPVAVRLERYRMPRALAVGLLLAMLAVATLVGLSSVRAVIPNETTALELRVRALYALHVRYRTLMGLDPSWNRGNGLYRLTHRDLDPLMDRVSEVLALTPEEHAVFAAIQERGTGATAGRSAQLLDYARANTEALEIRAHRTGRVEPATGVRGSGSTAAQPSEGTLRSLGTLLTAWMVAPLIFLFLLWDTGRIKRGLLRAVPNRLFEPTLAVLHDIDQALGNYVRGMFLECCALGLTVAVFLTLVGVPVRWAIAIGTFTAASNVIPYMGSAAALLCGLAYALLAESVHPLIPLVNRDTFALWVVGAVALAELLKNVVYDPIVLGGAVRLHPLVVVIAVAGGAALFGPAGMLLAVPTVSIVKVLVASSAGHMKAYGLI